MIESIEYLGKHLLRKMEFVTDDKINLKSVIGLIPEIDLICVSMLKY